MNKTDWIADLGMIWKQTAAVFPYFDRISFDWDQVYREYLQKVMDTEGERELHLLLAEFVNRLGDGHTDYTPPAELLRQTGHLPFELGYTDGAYYIGGIEKGGEEHLLASVVGLNGIPFTEYLQMMFRYVYHVENYIGPLQWRRYLPLLLKREGNELTTSAGRWSFDLAAEKPELVTAPQPRAACKFEDITRKNLVLRLYSGKILYIRMDSCMYANAHQEVEKALTELRPKGVILDIRQNVGGMTLYGAQVAEKLISGQFSACRKRTRQMRGLDIACASQYLSMSDEEIEESIATGLGDREEVERCRRVARGTLYENYENTYGSKGAKAIFTGPCVLLISRRTVSAAEDLTAMFQSAGRSRLIGTPTYGSTGTPLLQRLSRGGMLRVCSVGYRLLDGREFIGRGIQPDVVMDNTLEDLRKGKDRVLDYAISCLSDQI